MTIICVTQKLNPTINKKEIAWKRICFKVTLWPWLWRLCHKQPEIGVQHISCYDDHTKLNLRSLLKEGSTHVLYTEVPILFIWSFFYYQC